MLSLLLGRYGVRSRLLERRTGASILPRATGINLRTMEILRSLGLAEAVNEASMDVRGKPLWVELQTLRGPTRADRHIDAPSGVPRGDFPSPAAHLQCAQDRLEPILLSAVRDLAASEVQFGHEVLSVRQGQEEVVAEIRDGASEQTYELRADYLVAADGANSTIRNALGVDMEGDEHLGRELNILFQADLAQLVTGHEASLYRVRNEAMEGIFRPVDDSGRWTLTTPFRGETSAEHCLELIRGGSGDPGIDASIVAVQEWELGAATARRFSVGRVFLIGDAAHRMTPGGAMGMNTAVQGAHNLAWKLAAAVQGWGGPRILGTYEAERRPVAGRNVALSLAIWHDMTRAGRTVGAVLGFCYDSSAVIPDGTPAPSVVDPIVDFVPTARPGCRAPHHWLELDGRRISTIDLFDGSFVLCSPSSAALQESQQVASALRIPFRAHLVGDTQLRVLYGVGDSGAVLVRPDGHVAWRTAEHLDSARFEQALTQVLALAG